MTTTSDLDSGLLLSGIDDLVRAKSQAEKAKENLVFALESARMGTWEVDIRTQRITCSETMLGIWGILPGEFTGERGDLQSRVHPDDADKMRSQIDAAIRSRGVFDLEYRVYAAPGVLKWVHSRGRCVYDPGSDEPTRFSGVVYDVTDRKLAEEERELYTRKLHEVYTVVSLLSRARTEADVLKVVESHALASFRASSGAFFELSESGTELRLLVSRGLPDERRSRFQAIAALGELAAQRALTSGEAIFLRSVPETGAEHSILDARALAAIPVTLADAKLGVFSFGFSNPREFPENTKRLMVTLATHCGEALERARLYDRSQKAVHARDTMISISAHELLTPITGSKLHMQVLRTKLEQGMTISAESLLKVATQAERNLERLGKLVDDMLDVSRINLGKLTLRKEDTDLTHLIDDAIERSLAMATSASCALSCSIRPGVRAPVDAYRIEQVLANLLSNACRYAPGKPIEVTLDVPSPGIARLTVKDHGAGIKPEDQTRIFERFERASTSLNEKLGLGLGLFIVKQIVDAHDGSVRVRSELGSGAEFVVELPASLELSSGAPSQRTSSEADRTAHRRTP